MQTNPHVDGNAVYSIRRDGQIVAQSRIVNLGYPQSTLRALAAAGYAMYCDGKRVKIK